ncbi:MAG: hypothetical protein EOM03_16565 [Clostridia bacterium]|nr:hypothetical protein [Clostridia bacterium]
MSIRQTLDGKVLIHCFAGCTFAEVAAVVRGGPASQAQTASRSLPSAPERPPRDWTKFMLPLPAGDLSFADHLARKLGVGHAKDYVRLYPCLRLIPSALGTPAIAVYDPLVGGQAMPLFKDTFSSHTGRKYKKYTIPGTNCKIPLFLPRCARQEKGDIEVFVTEGISDWLSLASQDASPNRAYTAMLGAAQNLDEDVARQLQSIKTYCMFDSDTAGEAGARKFQMLTGCIRLAPPDGHKDWRDHLRLITPYRPLYR